MPRNPILIQNQNSAHTLIAKPSPTWNDADVLAACDLLQVFNNVDHPAAPFNELENTMASAPIRGFPAALAKARWFTEQPCAEQDDRQPWEPAAIRSLQDFLSPKEDFVADLGLRMGAIIEEKQGLRLGDRFDRLHAQQMAVEELIAITAPTSLAGVVVHILMGIRNLATIAALANEHDCESLSELINKTQAMLEMAAPMLADISGVDLDADYGAYYGTSCGERQKSRRPIASAPDETNADDAPAQSAVVPVNPWAETIAGYIAAPAHWWNDGRLSDAVLTAETCREWVSSTCESEPPPSSEKFAAITTPLCDLVSAIMAAPVEGVLGAHAKLRLIKDDDWDARHRTDIDVCLQSILDGLNAVLNDQAESSARQLQEAA